MEGHDYRYYFKRVEKQDTYFHFYCNDSYDFSSSCFAENVY